MDIYCSKCGEPWDIGELNNVEGYTGVKMTFKEAKDKFYEVGCEVFGTKHNLPELAGGDTNLRGNQPVRPFRAQLAEAMQGILGDDVDGLASMMEDAEFDMGSEFWEDGE